MAYDTGFSRRSSSERILEPVAIISVDPVSRTAIGVTRTRYTININCAYATGDTITTPAAGDQWYVEKFLGEWRLYGRIPFNDATLNIEPEEGQVSVGSASGPLELNGTEIRANARVLRLNGAYYRDSGATLERSKNGTDGWEPIFANASGNGTAGVLQMLANKIADIPVTPEITEFLAGLTPAETEALADLAEWADSVAIGGSGWLPLCDNPFFVGLQDLGVGANPLDKIMSGFQSFLNDLVGLLFCQFQGDVTPQALTTGFDGLQQVFIGQNQTGDFLRGLQGLLPVGDQANNLLLDSVNGAVKFIQDLFDILFCTDSQVAIDPAAIITELGSIFDPLKSNPFLLGLQEVFTDAGNAATNLFTDSVEGAVTIIEQLFSALFCDFDFGNTDFTPKLVFEQIQNSIIAPLRDNPVIKNLTEFAEKMGDQIRSGPNLAFDGKFNFTNINRFPVNAAQTSGYSAPPRDSRHKLFTFAGTATPDVSMFQAIMGIDVDPEIWEWVPVIYPHWFPVSSSVETGVRNCIDAINAWPGKFGLSGYSQGAIVCSSVLWELRFGSLQHRYADLIGAVMFGNPKREEGVTFPGGIDPGGAGMAPDNGQASGRIQNTPALWWEFANHNYEDPANGLHAIPGSLGSDPFTVNPLTETGEWITAIYQFMLQEFNGSDADLLPRLQELFSPQILSSATNAVQSIIHLFKGFGVGHMEYGWSRPLPNSELTSVELGVQHLNAVGNANPLTPQTTDSNSVGRSWFWNHVGDSKSGLKLTPNGQVEHFIVSPGDTYFLEGDVMPYGANATSGSVQIGATLTDTTSTLPSTEVFFSYPQNQAGMALGKWNTVKTSVTIPAGYNRAVFSIRTTESTQAGDKFWVDNVAVRRNTNVHPIVAPIEGLVELFQTLFGLLTCDLPQSKIDDLDEFISQATGGFVPNMLDFLQNKLFRPLQGSFVQGLAEMFRASSNLNRSLLEDAVAGAEQFIEVIQDIVTCNIDGTLIGNITALVGPDAVGVTPAKIVKLLDDFFGTFRDNPFILGLQQFWTTLGNQATTVAQDAVQGATEFVQYIFDLILCKPNAGANLTAIKNLAGTGGTNFTPAKIIADIDGFFDGFRNNDFIKGLQDFWTTLGNDTENFLQDAVSGASRFVEFLFDLVTCQLEEGQLEDVLSLAGGETGLTPSRLIQSIEDFFDGFRSNPFVTGLANIWTSLGNTTHGLLRDVADGVTEFFQVIFGALNCDLPQLVKLNTLAGSAAATGSTPVGILASLKQTFLGANGDGGLLGNAWVQIFNGIADRQGFTGNLLNKITDGFAEVADFFFDILDNLFPSIDFRAIITDFPNGFPTGLPTLQEWLEDLNLGKLLDPFNLGGWFQDNIFRPVLKALTGLSDTQLDALIQNPLANIGLFFTNIRKFFGADLITNWLSSFGGGLLNGSFNPITALQTFISDVLVEGIDTLWDTLVEGLTSISNKLVKALTGQPITGVIGDGLKAIKDFFGGFAGFNPLTGENSLISQIVKEIVGEDGQFTLEDLGRFFNFTGDNSFANIFKLITDAITTGITGFTTGPIKALADFFDPTKTNNVFKGLVDAITTGATTFLSGPIKAIADFFNPTNGSNVFKNLVDVITGAVTTFTSGLSTGPLKVLFDFFDPNKTTNVFKNLVDAITNHTTAFANGPLKALADFFDFDKSASLLNTIVETMIGGNILSGTGPLAKLSQLFSGVNLTGGKSLMTQIIDQVNYIAEVLGLNSIVASITKIDIDELENSYTLTFGGSPTGGTFTLAYGGQTTAAITYSTTTSTTAANIKAALDALTNIDASIVTFASGKYTVALNNTDGTLALGTASLTGGASPTLGVAQKFRGSLDALTQFFTGFNPFTGGSGTNLLQQILTQAGSDITEFVSKITGIDVEDLTNPLGAVEKFFDGLTDIFNPDTGENNFLSQIIKKIIPTGTGLADLGQFFTNLRGLFGMTGTGPLADILSGDFLSVPAKLADAATRFVTSFLSKAGSGTLQAIAKIPATILSNLGIGQIDDLVKVITGQEPGAFNPGTIIQTFFAGLGGVNTSIAKDTYSLVSQIANAITGKSGANPLTDIRTFFGIGTGGLLDFSGNNTIPVINQIVKAITGKTGTSHPLADIAAFLGIGPTTDLTTLDPFSGANSLIKQIVEKIIPSGNGLDQMKKFFDNLRDLFGLGDASGFLGTLTGGNLGDIGANFINNVLSKAGTGTLSLAAITKIPGNLLSVGISNIENLISTLTGGTSTTQLANFFANLRKFLNIGTSGTNVVNFFADPASFSVQGAIDGFIKNIIKTATAIGEIPATLIGAFSPEKITGLIEKLTGKTVGAVEADLTTFFDNLRKTFNVGSGAGQINLLNPAATLSGLQDNLFTFVSGLQSGINSFITKSGLGTWLGATGTEINNFFANLTKFFKLDFFKLAPTGTGVGAFNLATAAGDFIQNVINEATGFLINPLKILGINDSGNLKDDVSARPALATLLGWVTGTGTVNAFDSFFTNIKNLFGGNINLLGTTFSASTAQQNFVNVIKTANDTVEAFISKSGLQSWLGATTLTEIGNFFQNITKFFKIGDFKLAPTGTGVGVFDIATAAGKFIKDFINQATGFLIDPLKVLGLGGAGTTLFGDLGNRPILTDLRTWLTTANAQSGEDIQKFFTNLRTTLGINFLPSGGAAFNTADAQKVVHDVIANINSGLTAGQKWATQATADAKAAITEIVEKITGVPGATTLNGLSTFFGGFTSTASTLIGKVVADITGLITNGLAGLNLTQFFSGFNGATTATDSLAHKISQAVSGGAATTMAQVDNFFKNIRTFLGIGTTGINLSDFLGDVTSFGTKLTGIVNSFITNVLKRSGLPTTLITLGSGETKLSDLLIPDLSIAKITDLVSTITGGVGTAAADLQRFFTNLRIFLGGGTGFLSGSFSLTAAVENFINNVLKAPSIGIKLVTTGINNLLDGGLIPDLGLNKIPDLAKVLTGSLTAVTGDVEKFFTNLRTMFGGTNFAPATGTNFDFVGAANQFITNVLSKATSAVSSLIPANVIANFDITKITNLINFITGATGTAATNPDTLKNFFAGFTPFTGVNTIVNQITQAIFGTGGTLAQLQTFFSGLGAGFNPTNGSGNIVQQFVQQITGKVGGVLADIGSFLGIGPVSDSTTFNPFTGANSLINQIVTKIVPAGSTLTDMTTFFTNFRNLFGATNFLSGTFDFPTAAKAFIDNVLSKVNSVATKIPGLAIGNLNLNQITDLLKNILGIDTTDGSALQKFFAGFSGFDITTGANSLINQFVTKITGNNGQALTDLNSAFTNLRNFLGFNPVSTGGAGTLGTAVNEFFTKLNTVTPTTKLNPATLLQGIGMGQINDLNRFLTGSSTAVAADVEKFFTNLRTTFGGINFLPTTTFDASAAQRAIHDFVSSINSGLTAGQKWATQAVADAKATITEIVQKITGTTGSTTLNPLETFFAGISGSGGSLVNQFVSKITGTGTTLANLETTFANLRSFLGFSPLATASAAASVNSFFGTLNGVTPTTALNLNTVGTDLNIEKVASLASFVTGGGATTTAGVQTFFNNLRNFLGFNPFSAGGSTTFGTAVNTFFGNLNTITPTTKLDPAKLLSSIGVTQISNLVSSLTGTGSSSTDLATFFTNLRSTFSGVNFLPAGVFDPAVARKAIHDFVASVNAGLAAGSKWATQAVADAKAGIADIVQRITGATGATDLTGLGNFFSGLVGTNGSLVAQFVTKITGGTTGTLADLTTTFTNLRDFLGFNPFGGFTNLATAVNNFFTKLNTVTPGTKLDPAKLLSAIGMGQISDFITFVTGSSGGTLPQIQSFFNTIRDFLGFNPASAPAFATAVTTFFGKLNTVTPTTKLDPAKLFQDIDPTKIASLVPFITGSGTVGTDIQTFFTRLRSILGGVNPMSAASTAAESANLFTALNQASGGSLGTAKVAGIENPALSTDLRSVFNNVVLGLQGKTTADLTGTNQFGLADILSTAKGTSETITGLAEAVTVLQKNADVRTNSGNSDFATFSTFAPFNNGGGLTYLLNAGASALGISGTQAVWQNAGATVTRAAQGIFTRTKTATDWQKIGIAFATAPTADSVTNANSGFNYILGRSNGTGGEHVFVKFSKTGFRVGYTTTGLNTTPSETFFSNEVSHNFTAGATYYLECGIPDGGINTGQTTYRVSRNGVPLLTITSSAYNAYTNADHRYGGFKVQATNFAWWVNPPGSMAAFAINDNTPAPYIGSGFRRYRNATNQTVPTVGENLLPNGFFNNADFSTADYEYSSTASAPNKVAVKTTGWYKVDVNLGLVADTMLSEIAPTLYKNGALESRGGSVIGGRFIDAFPTGIGLSTNRGPSQAAASFSVYLQAGEYIQPGYWQPRLSGTFTGDSSGVRTYMQVTFMNRSTE